MPRVARRDVVDGVVWCGDEKERRCVRLGWRYYYFHRFAHSAGPGIVRQRVEWIGSGFAGLMQSSE